MAEDVADHAVASSAAPWSFPGLMLRAAVWLFYLQGCIILPHVWGLYFEIDLESRCADF